MELSIRKLGNSAGLILPATLLRTLNLTVGSSVKAEQVEGALIITPAAKKRYLLTELVARCDVKTPVPKDIAAWDEMTPVGKEFS